MNEFCLVLSSHPTALSTLRLLKVIRAGEGYIVNRDIFDHLIEAYASAPTDHRQKLCFEKTKIKARNVDPFIPDNPNIEGQYRRFKYIALQDCKFVSTCRVNREVISHWLDEKILVQENDQSGFCQFRVKDRFSNSKKRKYSELEQSS